MTLSEFTNRLDAHGCKPTGNGSQLAARCPAHEDNRASLSVSEASGKLLLHCHAGCKPDEICGALGLKLADLFNGNGNGTPKRNGGKSIVATYDYRDESGALLFQVCRFDPKDFRQRRPDPDGRDGWTWSTQGVRRVLFRLPEISRDVKRGLPIIIAEGEKDCLALAAHGFSATCNAGGAGKWLPDYGATLRGASVIIIADKDAPGREHAADVAGKLHGTAASVKVLELPDTNGKPVKDAADYFAAGGTAPDLIAIIDAAPEWKPTPPPAPLETESSADEITAWIRGQMLAMLADKESLPTVKYTSFAGHVVEALQKLGRFYFHADLRDFDSAMFFDSHRKRLERIRSDAFAAWLSQWLVVNRSNGVFKYVTSGIETAALSGKQTTGIVPESFWAARPGTLFLSNGDGQAIKITAEGVATVDNGTDGVLFAAGCTLAPWKLTEPRDPFETCALFRNFHSGASHGKDLLRLWFYSFATMPRSKPPIGVVGEVGSGKTRTLKGVAELYGIPFQAAKVEEQLEPNFWPNVNQGGLFILDNADTKCRWLADAVAAAATDGSSKRRKLYTNSETVTHRANAWIAITSANPTFGNDAGLADRLLLVRMERRPDETSSDAALTDEIVANRDAGLSHVAYALSKALADTGPTPPGLNQRHPDFAAFAVRIGRALVREAEAIAALRAAEADKSAFCLENDSIASALLTYLGQARAFTGTAAELAPHLIAVDPDLAGKLSAKRLGKRLSALWPHLSKSLGKAKKDTDRTSVTRFTFEAAAGFAGFQMDFSQKS